MKNRRRFKAEYDYDSGQRDIFKKMISKNPRLDNLDRPDIEWLEIEYDHLKTASRE